MLGRLCCFQYKKIKIKMNNNSCCLLLGTKKRMSWTPLCSLILLACSLTPVLSQSEYDALVIHGRLGACCD